MAKQKSIRHLMKYELGKMKAYGESKHDYQQQTRLERAKAKAAGMSDDFVKRIDCSKGKIFSQGTMNTYIQQVDHFADYLESKGMKKVQIKIAKLHIQLYLDYMKRKGYSSYSIHTAAAALSKTFGTSMYDYDIPRRSVADITKGKNSVPSDSYNERKMAYELAANRLLGMRKNALSKLKVKDIVEKSDRTEVHSKGKGGKHNMQIFFLDDERQKVRELCKGKSPNDYVFDKDKIRKSTADFHHERAMRAKEVYFRVEADMRDNPEKRAYYRSIIEDILKTDGKRLPHDLDTPYIVRGKHRVVLLKEGKQVSYDRLALMFVSLTVTNHYRVDVTLQNYVAK